MTLKKLIDRDVYKLDNILVGDALKEGFFKYDDIINIYDAKNEEHREVMQWFCVSEWLANLIIKFNGVILSNNYGYWWGRCGCGYALENEEVLIEIVEYINGEYGLDWEV